MLLRIDHVGIACRNLDEAIARYESVFGLTVASREENLEQGVREAMLQVGQAGRRPDLGSAAGADRARTPRWASSSPAAGRESITWATPWRISRPRSRRSGRRTSARSIERPRHGSMGASIAFLHPADLGGVLTELVEPADWLTRPAAGKYPGM